MGKPSNKPLMWLCALMCSATLFSHTAQGLLFVANEADASVSVFDSDSHSLLATIAVGNEPTSLALHPGGHTLYVSNRDDNSISVIDSHSLALIDTLAVDDEPFSLALQADGRQLFVSHYVYNGGATAIDTLTHTITASIPVLFTPGVEIVGHPDNQQVYVLTDEWNYSYVDVIDVDTLTVSSSFALYDGSWLSDMVFHPSGDTGYGGITYWTGSHGLSKIETFTSNNNDVTDVVQMAEESTTADLAIHPSGQPLYLASRGNQKITALNLDLDIVNEQLLNENPHYLASDPHGDKLYVSLNNLNQLLVLNSQTLALENTLNTGAEPGAIAVTTPLGGVIQGLSTSQVQCHNLSTGEMVSAIMELFSHRERWHCETAGLAVQAGDKIQVDIRGIVQDDASVRGWNYRLSQKYLHCINASVQQRVVSPMNAFSSQWQCGDTGLAINPGDVLGIRMIGRAN